MKLKTIAAIAAAFCALSALPAFGDDEPPVGRAEREGSHGAGNGGGLIVRNEDGIERVYTFANSGVVVYSEGESGLREIPGLTEILENIKELGLENYPHSRLRAALRIRPSRKYFDVTELDDETREKIEAERRASIAQYEGVIKTELPTDLVDVGAIHTPPKEGEANSVHETYLFPRFGDIEGGNASQQAILFVEALRALKPDLSYATAALSQIAYESWLSEEKPTFHPWLHLILAYVFEDPYFYLRTASKSDVERDRLPKKILDDRKDNHGTWDWYFPYPALFGQSMEVIHENGGIDRDVFESHLVDLREAHPKSHLILAIFNLRDYFSYGSLLTGSDYYRRSPVSSEYANGYDRQFEQYAFQIDFVTSHFRNVSFGWGLEFGETRQTTEGYKQLYKEKVNYLTISRFGASGAPMRDEYWLDNNRTGMPLLFVVPFTHFPLDPVPETPEIQE